MLPGCVACLITQSKSGGDSPSDHEGRGSGAGFLWRSAGVVVFGGWSGRARVRLMEGAPRFTAHNNFAVFIEDRFSRCAAAFIE